MNNTLLSDRQLLSKMGDALEQLRLHRGLQDADIIERGGVTKDALAKFKRGDNITTLNLIKILRGAGLLDKFISTFDVVEERSLLDSKKASKQPKRIHKKLKPAPFQWEDEQ